MLRMIVAVLLLSASLMGAPDSLASGSASTHAAPQPRSTTAMLAGVCSLLLFLRVRKPRGPK